MFFGVFVYAGSKDEKQEVNLVWPIPKFGWYMAGTCTLPIYVSGVAKCQLPLSSKFDDHR